MIIHNMEKYYIHHKSRTCRSVSRKLSVRLYLLLKQTIYHSRSFIRNFESEAGQQVPIFENIILIDSFNFMLQSLDSLVADLHENCFLRSKYESYINSDYQVLSQNNYTVIPTSHQNNFMKQKSCRHYRNGKNNACGWNQRQGNQIQSGLNSVFQIWLSKRRRLPRPLSNLRHFAHGVCFWGIQRYLLWHVRLGLCRVLWSNKLILKGCKPDLHLLTEREEFELVENMMRWGLSPIYVQRHFQQTTNLPNYQASKPSTYALMQDANIF